MNRGTHIIIAAVLLAAFTGIGYAVSRMASVEKSFEEVIWIANPELPNGGVIVGRGEGSSGVITVEIEPMTQVPENPVQLTWEDVSSMDITVVNENGVEMHFGNKAIETSAYLFEFTHDWGNDIIVSYELRNNYTGNGN